jgi:hypothetical protein
MPDGFAEFQDILILEGDVGGEEFSAFVPSQFNCMVPV